MSKSRDDFFYLPRYLPDYARVCMYLLLQTRIHSLFNETGSPRFKFILFMAGKFEKWVYFVDELLSFLKMQHGANILP